MITEANQDEVPSRKIGMSPEIVISRVSMYAVQTRILQLDDLVETFFNTDDFARAGL